VAEARALLTAFEPFGEREVNSSERVLAQLRDDAPAGVELHTAVLPVSFTRAWPTLRSSADRVQPDAVVLLGQAARRTRVEVERVAVNIADTTTPDNDGARPSGEQVVAGGPPAHLATAPVQELVVRMRAAGVPAGVSDSAGTYVCNHVYYLALQHLRPRPVVFVHLPLLPEQSLADGDPTMSLDLLVCAVSEAVRTVAASRDPAAG
jgi:pyroglutamyl-peptidase